MTKRAGYSAVAARQTLARITFVAATVTGVVALTLATADPASPAPAPVLTRSVESPATPASPALTATAVESASPDPTPAPMIESTVTAAPAAESYIDWVAKREVAVALGEETDHTPAPSGLAMRVTPAPAQDDAAPEHSAEMENSFLQWLAERNAGAPRRSDRVSLEAGLDWTSGYFFRGFVQERNGVIVQPYVEAGFDLTGDDAPVSVNAFLGVWNSVHSETTGAGTTDGVLEHYYETDLYAGMHFGIGDLTVSTTYWLYLSPSDAFETVQEIELGLAYDDSAFWENGFALNPGAKFGFEISGTGNDGLERGTYFELSLRPTWEVGDDPTIELSVPMTLGFSLDDYYQDSTGDDSTFGYFDVGIEGSMDLPGDGSYGQWSIGGGVHVILLGDSARELNDGRSEEIVGRFGIGVSF